MPAALAEPVPARRERHARHHHHVELARVERPRHDEERGPVVLGIDQWREALDLAGAAPLVEDREVHLTRECVVGHRPPRRRRALLDHAHEAVGDHVGPGAWRSSASLAMTRRTARIRARSTRLASSTSNASRASPGWVTNDTLALGDRHRQGP